MTTPNNNKSILVTGGSGFLGIHLIESLRKAGYKIRVFDKTPLPYEISDVEFILGDLNEETLVNMACNGINIIFHFAAFSDLNSAKDNPMETVKINILGTTNLLEAARKNKVEQFIFSSSIYVHSRTGGFYKVTKHSCELIIEEYSNRYGIKYNILRFGTLYGPMSDEKNSVYYYLKQALKNGKINALGTGDEIREYIDVRDASDFCIKILEKKLENKILILTGHHRMTLRELLEIINEILGNNINISYGKNEPAHYKYTPYSYNKNNGIKLVMDSYRDIGQGLVEILNEIDN